MAKQEYAQQLFLTGLKNIQNKGEKNSHRWRVKDSKIYKSIKDRCYEQFIERKKKGKKIIFVSDKLGHYKKGFNKFFRTIAELRFGISIKQKKHGYKHNNNTIERDNREVKQRYHSMIEFKKIRSANTILDFFDLYDNYIDKIRLKGEKKWRTPAERANIKLDLGDNYYFLNLIRVSKIK